MRHPVWLASLAAASFLGAPVAAAAEPTPLSSERSVVNDGYGGPTIKATTLAADPVLIAGGEAGWIIARSLIVGVGGYGTLTNVVSPASLQSPSGNARLGLGYGGLRTAAILGGEHRIHATIGMLVGAGSAWSESTNYGFHRNDAVIVIEPDVQAEANLVRHFRLALGIGYRFIGSADQPGFSAFRLGGPVALATLRVGDL